MGQERKQRLPTRAPAPALPSLALSCRQLPPLARLLALLPAVAAASPTGSGYCNQCHWLHLPFQCPCQGLGWPPSLAQAYKQMAETWAVFPPKANP